MLLVIALFLPRTSSPFYRIRTINNTASKIRNCRLPKYIYLHTVVKFSAFDSRSTIYKRNSVSLTLYFNNICTCTQHVMSSFQRHIRDHSFPRKSSVNSRGIPSNSAAYSGRSLLFPL